MSHYELELLNLIQKHLRSGPLDRIMTTISLAGTAGAVWIIIALLLFTRKKTRAVSVSMIFALIIGAVICSGIIKPLAARLRPFQINTAVQLLVPPPHDYSFPSGHTTAAFGAASSLLFRRSRLWPFFMAAAVLMAFSRLYLYVHFPTDVLAGCVLGFFSGWAGYRLSLIKKEW